MKEKHYTTTFTNPQLTGCTKLEFHTIEIAINETNSVEIFLN